MTDVVLATRNDGKLKEMQTLFAPLGFKFSSQKDHDLPSVPETGKTFVENALIKAHYAAGATGQPAIADDSGLVVPALNGQPGIYSARYAGEDATDADNNAKLLDMLKDSGAEVPAYFYCAMVYVAHGEDPTPHIATAAWHGAIIESPRGANGFGYDPLFLVQGMNVTSAELPATEKNAISHRGQACQQLLNLLS